MKRLLNFYAVRYSTKNNKRSSFKREWLLPFPSVNVETARASILEALRPAFELKEFDRYELALVGSYSFASGSFVGKPTDFIDITDEVRQALVFLKTKSDTKDNK